MSKTIVGVNGVGAINARIRLEVHPDHMRNVGATVSVRNGYAMAEIELDNSGLSRLISELQEIYSRDPMD